MRIAITGSWRHEDEKTWELYDRDGFFRAVRSIGTELVKLGHRLVVATDSAHTADRAAVDGAIRAFAGQKQKKIYESRIELLRSDDKEFHALALERPGLLVRRSAPEGAEIIKLYQVHRADVVLAAGGAEKTFQAIVAAAASGKRVVPIGAFGGAANRAVKLFECAGSWGPHIPSHDILGALAARWTPASLELVLPALLARVPRVLIVHGRDLESRDQLARHLTRLGIQPTIMGLEATLGLALPEKFERLAQNVDCAIALVTPDDVARLRGKSTDGFRPRARQNVWVEVGWFWGALGRSRVLLLGKKGVELPNDLSGLLVEEFTSTPEERGSQIAQWIEGLGWPRPTLTTATRSRRV